MLKTNSDVIPVIDLFAGPGGLSEGFSAFNVDSNNLHPFKIVASVEMDTYAHKTLELRSFYHEFLSTSVPDEYYQYLRQEITREDLFSKYPIQASNAKKRAIKATLGSDDDPYINQQIHEILSYYDGNPWILIGGPPCQAYSLIGRSRRQANGIGHDIQQQDKRNFLYLEYLRILAKFRPAVFVMENVKGMLSAQVNNEKIVNKIFQDLRHPGKLFQRNKELSFNNLEYHIYSLVTPAESDSELNPDDYLIHAEKYGIPQARHRVILLGIRSDIDIKPDILKPNPTKITVSDVISDLPPLRSFFTKTKGSEDEWYKSIKSISNKNWFKNYKPCIKNGRKVEPDLLKKQMHNALNRLQAGLNTGGGFIKTNVKSRYRSDWFSDNRLGGVINHSTRGHMKEDLWRYFFCSVYAEIYGYSPIMKDFPKELLPKHKNVQTKEAVEQGDFGNRFRVQDAGNPAATITCHISKDGHYSIHYDPSQCRSLTVREAARLQTFPDNYYFEGPRTEQFHQVGNAVPPLLALQIANIVYKVIVKIQNKKHTANEINSKSKFGHYFNTEA